MGEVGVSKRDNRLRAVIGAKLRARRLELGYSLEGMAQSCGVSKSTLSVWERGERAMTLDDVERLAAELGQDAVQLLSDSMT